ncbi:GNAT family N-acetyltransferase [Conexibacter sp. CPCC 206217]|uniref:GNAT family N-acetyltransferase n=1 Tax=Conexibacter sp. CPCC 206217 TaxID=3064574 RepID=UPI00271CF080|nr:GNAT family N-acetyltransferase [Conexibacter sp. CPCC 206217]MDO8211525.1 GNAT family N-acetyltransferase [Conexibacter sp. CPCC 206217]
MTVEIRRVANRAEMDAALAIRDRVFCVEQGVPKREEIDGRDPEAVHLVAVQDGVVVGTCRLLFVDRTVQFSRLAVEQSARRHGLATRLLLAADAEALDAGSRRIVLHAQTYARDLYLANGYEPHGRVFTEASIEHIAMEKRFA